MNFWKPIKLWKTCSCRIHSSVDVFIHSCFCLYVPQDVDQLCFMFIGGICLDGSVSVGIFYYVFDLLDVILPISIV